MRSQGGSIGYRGSKEFQVRVPGTNGSFKEVYFLPKSKALGTKKSNYRLKERSKSLIYTGM